MSPQASCDSRHLTLMDVRLAMASGYVHLDCGSMGECHVVQLQKRQVMMWQGESVGLW